MLPIFREDFYTFRFADDRIIPRFHLPEAAEGTAVIVQRFVGERESNEVLAEAFVGADGWVELTSPLIVRGGEGFLVRKR